MPSGGLTSEQTHALFDILTHHETYAEIEGFKSSVAVTSYGFPFTGPSVVRQTGRKSLAPTPVNSRPGTPRVRTPTSFFRSSKPKEPEVEEEKQNEEYLGPSTSPLLQMLLSTFVIGLPGVKDLPRDFWSVKVQGLLVRFGEADLSESYDKGALGIRKILATGSSGLIEMIARGALGGVKQKRPHKIKNDDIGVDRTYDHTKAEDLTRAWDDIVDDLIYGDLADKMFDYLNETDDLEAYSPAVKAAAQYAIIHLATLMHHIFVQSAEGQYLLKLLENIHNLIPYKMIKQTLRLGNATVMINAMLRILLAKMSVTSITNWVGLTANADDGMNLLQRIISMVLSWDASEFRKSAEKIEKAKERPSDEMLQAIRDHIAQGRDEHQAVRSSSMMHSQSIITAILNASNAGLNKDLTEQKHTQCLQYYSALLSVRDRECISATLCRQPPDLFTGSIKDAFTAAEPIIRALHSKLNRREHFEAYEAFVDDFIKTSKPKKDEASSSGWRFLRNGESSDKPYEMPSVEDYVKLLMRNRGFVYSLVHSVAKTCPAIWDDMKIWCVEARVKFQQERKPRPTTYKTDVMGKDPKLSAKRETKTTESGSDVSLMEERLNSLFDSLPETSKQPVLTALHAHATYLSSLASLSHRRLQRILDSSPCDSDSGSDCSSKSSCNSPCSSRSRSSSRPGSRSSCSSSSSCHSVSPGSSMSGPGMYLYKWQGLLDSTAITPDRPHGALRYGKDAKNSVTAGKTMADTSVTVKELPNQPAAADEGLEPPNVDIVVKELRESFRALLQGIKGQ
ncbi:hypothetical protein BGZ63DRAFT_407843 [Mariannaea sp. PMI_226]|nr:hypothetical protein BGZ63DRAFT_407843 [Mariannaea sp. PMI_226]